MTDRYRVYTKVKKIEKSIEMRMRRWVKDEIDVEAVYMPFARQILEALTQLPWCW